MAAATARRAKATDAGSDRAELNRCWLGAAEPGLGKARRGGDPRHVDRVEVDEFPKCVEHVAGPVVGTRFDHRGELGLEIIDW